MTVSDLKLLPYNIESSSIYFQLNSASLPGKFMTLNGIDDDLDLGDYTSKIICPAIAPDNTSSQYHGKAFIIGKKFYDYNYLSGSLIDHEYDFIDIVYSKSQDQLYALRDVGVEGCFHWRKCEIWKININSGSIQFIEEEGLTIDGQISSFFENPYDGRIYIHQKIDEQKLGDQEVRLLSFDPADIGSGWEIVDLGMSSYYPEYDHSSDPADLYFYNITTPYIDPYSNSIYLPNGGHSCVSKVSFTPYEPMLLGEGGWTWLSFPRMIRNFNDAVLIPDVLDDNIEPNTPPDYYLSGSKLQNIQIGTPNIIESTYNIDYGWNYSGYLENIQSTLGYKLYLSYDDPPDKNILFMDGNLYNHFDPNCNNCRFDLTGADEYWVGYYHLASQTIPDALPDEIESQIHIIKGQYFTCYSEENQTDGIIWRCVSHKGSARLKYGDMVEIIPVSGENIYDFYWAFHNNIPNDQQKEETEYYAYTETSDYTPIFVELDTTDNPLEIGAFINDSCIGASTVLPEDSVVLVPAYSDSLNGEIYFEQYYGSSKSSSPSITEYYVENSETKAREKRTIHTQENQHYYIVSFKNKQSNNVQSENNAWITCHPNPVKNIGEILFFNPQDGYAEIKLYSIFGTLQNTLLQGQISAGKHTLSFGAVDAQGRYLANGTYILSLKLADCQAQTKIVIIQ